MSVELAPARRQQGAVVEPDAQVAATSRLLVQLIVDDERYNAHWRQRTVRRTGLTNQAAIAQVLAEHLWSRGLRSDTETDLPRRLKDVVSRALGGRSLSARTLTWFIDAFDLSEQDAGALWSTRFAPPAGIREVRGHAEPAIPGWNALHRTLSLSELHTVGSDGIPVSHRTNQVIIATARMERYTYRFDAPGASVKLVHGGRASEARSIDDGLFAVEFEFPSPLSAGEVAFLEYVTSFAYEEAPEPEFRRAAYTRVEAVHLGVQFHPEGLPLAVSWAEWRHHMDPVPHHEEPVRVGEDGLVQSFVGALERATVGYRWRFND